MDYEEIRIKLPEPTSEGVVLSEGTAVKLEKYSLHSYNEGVAVIERFEDNASAFVGMPHAAVADTVGQHALQDKTKLADGQWFESEEEELDSYV